MRRANSLLLTPIVSIKSTLMYFAGRHEDYVHADMGSHSLHALLEDMQLVYVCV